MSRLCVSIVVVMMIALSACGKKHGANGDTGGSHDGPGTCSTDNQCTNAKCCSGVCVETASCAFAVTNVSPANGFINGGAWVSLIGAGFDPAMKLFVGDGRAPLLVTSPTTALIQTPPGPLGLQDIKITLGTAFATLHGGFEYRTAGLETQWEQKPLMLVRGEDPALAVMQDGRVLVAGGTTVPDSAANSLDTAEIYDRTTDMVLPVASTMSAVRWHDSAITLLTGKVLVVGGSNGDLQSADLFDPPTNAFTTSTSRLTSPRSYTRSVLMVDGRVFIASQDGPTVDIYNPATDTFASIANATTHVYGFVVRLRDGRVLLGGGDGVTAAELFDPDTNTFTPAAGPMVHARSMLTAHTLPSGKVIIIGGASSSAGAIVDPQASIEIFDPATNTFADAGYALVTPRTWHASALVRDGTVLVMGGYTVSASCASSVASVEQIDPSAGTVSPFPSLLNTNTEWTAATLLDGSVVGVGGGACGTSTALPDIDFLAGSPIQ